MNSSRKCTKRHRRTNGVDCATTELASTRRRTEGSRSGSSDADCHELLPRRAPYWLRSEGKDQYYVQHRMVPPREAFKMGSGQPAVASATNALEVYKDADAYRRVNDYQSVYEESFRVFRDEGGDEHCIPDYEHTTDRKAIHEFGILVLRNRARGGSCGPVLTMGAGPCLHDAQLWTEFKIETMAFEYQNEAVESSRKRYADRERFGGLCDRIFQHDISAPLPPAVVSQLSAFAGAGGAICCAVVQHLAWPQLQQFISHVSHALAPHSPFLFSFKILPEDDEGNPIAVPREGCEVSVIDLDYVCPAGHPQTRVRRRFRFYAEKVMEELCQANGLHVESRRRYRDSKKPRGVWHAEWILRKSIPNGAAHND